MSIIASVKVNNGIVLAADSATQIHGIDVQGNIALIKSYYNAKNLFQIGELPIGVMFYGIGNIGTRSVENLLLECNRDKFADLRGAHSVENISRRLLEVFQEYIIICFLAYFFKNISYSIDRNLQCVYFIRNRLNYLRGFMMLCIC